MKDWAISGWQELAVLMGVAVALSGIIASLIKGKIDHNNAEAAASDRLIRLIETEADKRVQIVRAEFELKIAEMELAHRAELEELTARFEREIQEIRDSVHLACDVPGCRGRVVTKRSHARGDKVGK